MTVKRALSVFVASALITGCEKSPESNSYAFDLLPEAEVKLFNSAGTAISAAYDSNAFETAAKIEIRGTALGPTPSSEVRRVAELSGATPSISSLTPTIALPVDGKTKQVFWWAASRLPSNDILITGGIENTGFGSKSGPTALNRSWIIAPDSGRISEGPKMEFGRMAHSAVALKDGRILVSGGHTGDYRRALSSCEVFDPKLKSFTKFGALNIPRAEHATTQLSNGLVLVVGGSTTPEYKDSGYLSISKAELFDPTIGKSITIGKLQRARCCPQVLDYGQDQAVVFGGYADDTTPFYEDGPSGDIKEVEILKSHP